MACWKPGHLSRRVLTWLGALPPSSCGRAGRSAASRSRALCSPECQTSAGLCHDLEFYAAFDLLEDSTTRVTARVSLALGTRVVSGLLSLTHTFTSFYAHSHTLLLYSLS